MGKLSTWQNSKLHRSLEKADQHLEWAVAQLMVGATDCPTEVQQVYFRMHAERIRELRRQVSDMKIEVNKW